jgi:hypothetical protein
LFVDKDLKKHLETSSVIKNQSLVTAEWNMNIATNVTKLGNYKYRPYENVALPIGQRSVYATLNNAFDPNDTGLFYTGATDSDIIIDGGYDNSDQPMAFVRPKQKEKLLYSLESCIERFRPRSGINKLRWFDNSYSHFTNSNLSTRPRYYMAHKDDPFKYWSSYRMDGTVERGIANSSRQFSGTNYIDDAAPFVVYSSPVPANRLVVKMQTNVGSTNLGPFSNSFGEFADPFFGAENMSVPQRWKVQYLNNGSWQDAVVFNEFSTRNDGSSVIGPDGYVELAYGLIIPEQYKSNFILYDTISTSFALPAEALEGQAWLVASGTNDSGTVHVWSNGSFKSFKARYGWYLLSEPMESSLTMATKLVNPDQFHDPVSANIVYREFQYVSGIRVVVDTMVKPDSTFDLIEMSPRLAVDLTDKVSSFNVTKTASDLGVSGLPVGQLLAGTGDVDIFDYDMAFSKTNSSSIIADYASQSVQIKFYETIYDVPQYDTAGNNTGLANYYVPLKTMFSEGFPTIDSNSRNVQLKLRDKFFYFEFLTAPQIFIQNVSLSYAVSTILDYIGFSNYTFKRMPDENEPIIPFFFIQPETSVAQVLQDLAISTQTTMFFDEYNNFVVMSKDYMLPSNDNRPLDVVLVGSKDFESDGVYSNKATNGELPLANIIEIASQDNQVYNDGSIQYTHRYIQRSIGKLSQASFTEKDQTWIYKPALLWEIAPQDSPKSVNNEVSSVSNYALTAVPLNSDLPDRAPIVSSNQILYNTIDLGEAVFWLGRYNGYLYANGEIIRFDAIQYTIPGYVAEDGTSNFWISSVREYQQYFSNIPFNGKLYPTGLVRIYTEPHYETIGNITRMKNGNVAKHGRGQFGTPVVYHNAGLNSHWTDNANVHACKMQTDYLFGNKVFTGTADSTVAGDSPAVAIRLNRTGIIKNFLSATFNSESELSSLYSTQTGTVQSSALVMQGGSFFSTETPLQYMSYVHKPLKNNYKHFGTRMRIVGRIENDSNNTQTASGSMSYFVSQNATPDKTPVIGGGSGGLGIFVNPAKNTGYFFEMIALASTNIDEIDSVADVVFYKVVASGSEAIPIKLWSGIAGNSVDDGNFAGQYRVTAEERPSVYDISVEYQDVGKIRKFYLYINGSLVQIVDDADPLPIYNNMALFVRGTSKCMFENVYALTSNYAQNTATAVNLPSNSVFANKAITVNDTFRKYALSGMVESSYLSNISPSQPPSYDMYFEEFGTIMREAAYMNVKYEVFPALTAQLSPTFSSLKGYTVSGFSAGAYGAEFLIFNTTDAPISLDETSGNYLRIQGAAITQESENDLTVDEYFAKTGSFSDQELSSGNSVIFSPARQQKLFYDIKNSRITYGKNAFSLAAPYIQSHDEAWNLMGWLTKKIMKPRMSVGIKIFSNPTIQLGDIVSIHYRDNSQDVVIPSDKKFVVYNISHTRSLDGPDMTVYLSEVGE